MLLAACAPDPAEVGRELDVIRGGCTKEGLAASDEACTRAAERVVGKIQEIMEISIGAIRTLDKALDRAPPARFDTTGLGHAISPP